MVLFWATAFLGANIKIMSIPSRHQTKAVLRFLHVIEQVNANYPNPITVDPSPLSSETFACRFRDAVRGVTHFGSYPPALPLVENWVGDFMVASIKGTNRLMIGPEHKVKELNRPDKPNTGLVIDASLPAIEEVSSPSQKVLEAIISLLEVGLLPHATVRGVTQAAIDQATQNSLRPIEVLENEGVFTLL